eukprot:NODE_411_length_2286_cov_34.983460_g378_i0.p1 GENE.NODE_411_length_2286_cov_34.983460_g378_i0~~NODE_411_length_2286_cov_34.983460_g378_i0.p1  ORF type:complete len:495 (-),score=49.12 NODE_411_length_2286_cov_34.983460_g378_i0:85-1569(-)
MNAARTRKICCGTVLLSERPLRQRLCKLSIAAASSLEVVTSTPKPDFQFVDEILHPIESPISALPTVAAGPGNSVEVRRLFAEAVSCYGRVMPSATWPPRCVAEGEGLTSAVPGHRTQFHVQTVSRQGQLIREGGDEVSVRIIRVPDPDRNAARNARIGTPVPVRMIRSTVTDHNNGRYTVEYLPSSEGEMSASVCVSGMPIGGSPFPITVAPRGRSRSNALSLGSDRSTARSTSAPPPETSSEAELLLSPVLDGHDLRSRLRDDQWLLSPSNLSDSGSPRNPSGSPAGSPTGSLRSTRLVCVTTYRNPTFSSSVRSSSAPLSTQLDVSSPSIGGSASQSASPMRLMFPTPIHSPKARGGDVKPEVWPNFEPVLDRLSGLRSLSPSEGSSYFTIDLGPRRKVKLQSYCLRGPENAPVNLRDWDIQGSNDVESWEIIKHCEHREGDPSGTTEWLPVETSVAYQKFRVVFHDKDTNDDPSRVCSGLELFGEVFEDD